MTQAVGPSLGAWPDADGALVRVGDFIAVWCSWTQQPKFEGRAVRVIQMLSARGQLVMRVQDPSYPESPQFLVAEGAAFRRVEVPDATLASPHKSGIRLRPGVLDPWTEAHSDNE